MKIMKSSNTTTAFVSSLWIVSTLAMALAMSWQYPAEAQSVTVVANPEVELSEIDQAELARIFLGKRTMWESGTRILPCMPNEKSPLTEGFLKQNLRKTVRQYRAYWKRRLFSGQGTAPKTFSNDRQVLDYVADNPGAIGVVASGAGDGRVKTLTIQ